MNRKEVVPEGCFPGVGCFSCIFPECRYSGSKKKGETLRNKKSPAVTAITARRKPKKSLDNYSTFRRKVNSMNAQANFEFIFY